MPFSAIALRPDFFSAQSFSFELLLLCLGLFLLVPSRIHSLPEGKKAYSSPSASPNFADPTDDHHQDQHFSSSAPALGGVTGGISFRLAMRQVLIIPFTGYRTLNQLFGQLYLLEGGDFNSFIGLL